MNPAEHNPDISPKLSKLIEHFQFDKIPIEGTLYKSTYVSQQQLGNSPIGTAIIGLYSEKPKSLSTFHRLKQDEVWHFYEGDPFMLHLLHENGVYEKVIMGNQVLQGQKVQFVVPANVWQAGELIPGGEYALYGCTLAPGFTGESFEGGRAADLLKIYPDQADIIQRLGVFGQDTQMPEGYTQ